MKVTKKQLKKLVKEGWDKARGRDFAPGAEPDSTPKERVIQLANRIEESLMSILNVENQIAGPVTRKMQAKILLAVAQRVATKISNMDSAEDAFDPTDE